MGGAFVMLDPESPWAPPPDLLDAWVGRAAADRVVVAVVLPVTDTVKELVPTPAGPVVGATHDREGLRRVVALVLPPAAVADHDGWTPSDLGAALAELREGHQVVLVTAAR